ncbi:MAG: agmatinase [Methanomicrobiaceae archaeon]|uniref:Agmatinase n=1 Tax=hydrocarbon metagenome TaxID=938273 RepID=A0A0W8FE99_9ZZZZ|nr:agmatinase [Methanomicrobiaceae archaeon]
MFYHLNHHQFADFETAYEDARYVVFGVPYDSTVSFRPGTRFGPRSIREMSYNFESFEPHSGIDLAAVPCADIGDVEPELRPEAVVEQVLALASDILGDGKVPVMLGGEHTVTIGAVRALMPECFVVCDAHLDLRDELSGSPYSHGCVTRRLAETGIEDIFIIGARSGTREQFVRGQDLRLYTADDVRARGIVPILEEIREAIGTRSMYLSIDADVIDCCLTPGLGTPEPFGLNPLDVREVVRTLGPLASGFDYVEVCPVDAGQTAAVAAQMVREFIASHRAKSRLP